VQLDTTFSGIVVQSGYEESAIGGSPVFNCSESTSCAENVLDNHHIPVQEYKFGDGVVVWAIPGTEAFNFGGVLYSDVGFGQLHEYDLMNSGQNVPFGGASGVIGFNRYPWQASGQPSFMSAISDQMTGMLQFKIFTRLGLTKNLEWKCSIDLFREWQNGTWTLGLPENFDNRADIAWAEQSVNQSTWIINITAISAGEMKNPPIVSWPATVSTQEQSLVWPQKLLDWYFTGIDATWSAADNTYRYPCNATLPDFTFGLGNGTFTIPGTYMPYQRDITGTTCITIVTGDNSTDPSHEYTFGSWWSQLGLLILDYENSLVGFMNKSSPLPIFDLSSLEVSL
jgi:hypothetical protein